MKIIDKIVQICRDRENLEAAMKDCRADFPLSDGNPNERFKITPYPSTEGPRLSLFARGEDSINIPLINLPALIKALQKVHDQLEGLADEAPSTPKAPFAIDMIQAERTRQVDEEGWTPSHDDAHYNGELAIASAMYALPQIPRAQVWGAGFWPFGQSSWKPSPDNRIKELVKAGALIVAEIERLQRQAKKAANAK